MSRVLALAAIALTAAVALTGCSGAGAGSGPVSPTRAACSASDCPGVVYVVGAHRNEPAPALPAPLVSQLGEALTAGRPVGVVTVEGAPRVLLPTQVVAIKGTTDANRRNATARDTAAIAAVIASASARTPGADLFTALQAGARAARAAEPQATELVVLDSGLTDTGAVNFTTSGMPSADPSEVAAFLLRNHELTDTTFRGLTVRFVGLGDTAAPQKALGEPQRQRLIAIWGAVITAGGGRAVVDETPQSGRPPRTTQSTRPVPVEQTPVWSGTAPMTLRDSSVGFVAGTATLRDPAAARTALSPIAAWLAADPSRAATITGRTSSEPVASGPSDRQLSLMRAKAIAALLVTMGAGAGQVHAFGVGYVSAPKDTTSSGAIDPAKAALNRAVVIAPLP